MVSNFSYKKKNRYLLLGALVLGGLSWFFSFQKTFDAVRLNQSLHAQLAGDSALSENPVFNSDKARAINAAYNLFEVDPEIWRNELWLRISNVASSDKYQLIYDSEKSSNAIADSIIQVQNIRVLGQFKDLVQLLDSAESIRGIGYIGSLRIAKPQRASPVQNPRAVSMELQFRAVPNSYTN